MDAYVRAGIDIGSGAVRYAEVAQDASGCTLSRLGCMDVDEGALRNAFAGREDERLRAVSAALADAFAGPEGEDRLDELRISIPSGAGHVFRAPLPAGAGPDVRRKHLRQDVDLLVAPKRHLRIVADALHREAMVSGAEAEWMHVLAVEDPLEEGLRRLAQGVPAKRVRLMSAAHAAVSAIECAEKTRKGASEATCVLGIGWRGNRLDYVLRLGDAWRFGGFAEGAEPVDAAYLGASAAARFGLSPADADTVYVYGDSVPDALFYELEAVFGGDIRPLRPSALPGVSVACSPSEAGAMACAGCVGAALYGGEGFFFRVDPSVPS